MNGQDVRGGNNEDMGDSEEGRRVETDHKIRKSKEILERTLGAMVSTNRPCSQHLRSEPVEIWMLVLVLMMTIRGGSWGLTRLPEAGAGCL